MRQPFARITVENYGGELQEHYGDSAPQSLDGNLPSGPQHRLNALSR